MGNEEAQGLKIDLINLDMEEIKINRELFNLQMQINAKLAKDKKIKLKKNYKKYAEKKLQTLEDKKRLLLESQQNIKNTNNNESNPNNKNENISPNNIPEAKNNNEEIKNKNEDNKLSLISNSLKENNKSNKFISDKIEQKNNENTEKKVLISNSENSNEINIKTIYTKKKSKLNNNDNKAEEEIKNDIEMKKDNNDPDNNRYENDIKDNELENLNINQYKRLFFDKLSSMIFRTNNKSMDNKNSSIVEELEVVGLSENEVLKDKLSEFLVGTSVASSSVQNKNNSSLNNNYYNNRAKSEISGINRQLISASKDNDEKNKFNSSTNDNNININYEQKDDLEVFEGRENQKRFGTGGIGEKIDTEETINKESKETGNNINEKYKIDERKKLKNNRNKTFFVLDTSSIVGNSSIKESENLE